jgi:outer membrane PBP1 activator LpoA protein
MHNPTRPILRLHACLPAVLAAAMLSGCGADVASTAVTTAKLQAMQADQAKAQEQQFKQQLGAAMQATDAAASAAGNP